MVRVLIMMFLIPVLGLGVVAATSAKEPEAEVVAQLVTRDRIVLIYAGSEGAHYTIKTQDGEVLDANLSDREFQAKHPDIYERIKPAIARPDQETDVIPWAGLIS